MSRSESKKGVGKSISKHPRACNKQKTQSSNTLTEDTYIQIPLSIMSGNELSSFENLSISNESPCSSVESENDKYKLIEGFPSRKEIRKRKSYVMSYNNNTKNADWVYEILNKSTLENNCKEQMSFGRNELTVEEIPVYQQGHLAAAANHRWCQEAYHDTHLMSNMVPQLSEANQGKWKRLEDYCRDLAKTTGCNVHVYTGPLYLEKKNDVYVPKTNPNNGEEKAVPTHLFKVVIVEKNRTVEKLECYMVPNEKSEYDRETDRDYRPSRNSLQKTDDTQPPPIPQPPSPPCYRKTIKKIQKLSGLQLERTDKPQHNLIDHLEKITWMGEDKNGELCEAKIEFLK